MKNKSDQTNCNVNTFTFVYYCDSSFFFGLFYDAKMFVIWDTKLFTSGSLKIRKKRTQMLRKNEKFTDVQRKILWCIWSKYFVLKKMQSFISENFSSSFTFSWFPLYTVYCNTVLTFHSKKYTNTIITLRLLVKNFYWKTFFDRKFFSKWIVWLWI